MMLSNAPPGEPSPNGHWQHRGRWGKFFPEGLQLERSRLPDALRKQGRRVDGISLDFAVLWSAKVVKSPISR